jgi:hypothetical protein
VPQIVPVQVNLPELLKAMPAKPENAAVMYAIMSNLAVIRMNLAGDSNESGRSAARKLKLTTTVRLDRTDE